MKITDKFTPLLYFEATKDGDALITIDLDRNRQIPWKSYCLKPIEFVFELKK